MHAIIVLYCCVECRFLCYILITLRRGLTFLMPGGAGCSELVYWCRTWGGEEEPVAGEQRAGPPGRGPDEVAGESGGVRGERCSGEVPVRFVEGGS